MNKKTRNLIINGLICIALYLIISNLPISDPLTPTGLKVIAIVVAAIYGWCTIDSVVPSIAAVVAYGMITPGGIAGAFLTGSGSFLIMMILAMLLICGIMVHTGLARTLAEKIVGSKLANGRPWMLTLLLLVAAGVLSLFIPGLAVVLVVWDIAYGIFDVCGFKKGDKYPPCIMIGICASATFGMVCSHVSTGVIPNVAIIQAIDPSLSLNAPLFTISSIICLIIFIALCMLVIKYIFKPDVSKLLGYKAPEVAPKFTLDQKRALVLVVAFIVLMTLPDLLPKSAVQGFLAQFGLIGWAFIFVGIALLIRNKDGSPFITLKQITDAGVYWDMLIMLGAIQVVCGALGNPELGVTNWMIGILSPLTNSLGKVGVVVVLMLLGIIVTNLLDSAVTTFVFTYILYTVCTGMGINTMGAFAILLHVSAFGMLLPACSPPLTLLYGKVPDGWITKKDILKSALPYVVVAYLVFIVIGIATMNMY